MVFSKSIVLKGPEILDVGAFLDAPSPTAPLMLKALADLENRGNASFYFVNKIRILFKIRFKSSSLRY